MSVVGACFYGLIKKKYEKKIRTSRITKVKGSAPMTKDDVIRLAREANFYHSEYADSYAASLQEIEAFAKLVAEHERWECAQLCEDWDTDEAFVANIAEAIRARSSHE